MICEHCQTDQSATLHHEVICTNCGAVLSESPATTVAEHPEQSLGAPELKRPETRKEREFLDSLKNYANALSLGGLYGDMRSTYFAHRAKLVDYRKRYSPEAIVSLIYITTRAHRPGQTLADYGGKVGVSDLKKLNNAYKRLSNVIQLPAPDISVASRISTVLTKIYEPLSSMIHLDADTAGLARQTRLVYTIAEQAGLEIGRHSNPLVVACVVVAAGSLAKIEKAYNLVDWDIFAEHISYSSRTIYTRYTELIHVLLSRAKTLPWLASKKITKTVVHKNLDDILQVCSMATPRIDNDPSSSSSSVDRHPPSYMHNAQKIQRRSVQISRASEYLSSKNDDADLLRLDVETRMIYFLLARQVPGHQIEEMDSHHIYERVQQLYEQEDRIISPEHLDDPELTERDMDDSELQQYLKPSAH